MAGRRRFQVRRRQARLYAATSATQCWSWPPAIRAVAAAQLRDRTDTQAPAPVMPDQAPPPDPGQIPLTVPEIKHLLASRLARSLARPRRPLAELATPPPGPLPLVSTARTTKPDYALVS